MSMPRFVWRFPAIAVVVLLVAIQHGSSLPAGCGTACSGDVSFFPSGTADWGSARDLPGPQFKPKPPGFDFSQHIVPNGLENPLPLAFRFGSEDREAALACLAKAIYYEAAVEDEAGQAAVAQVVINRVHHPLYPDTICGVVGEGQELGIGCQFTFMCDGSLLRRPSAGGWNRAVATARAFLDGRTAPHVGMATHYHADYVYPYWADRLQRIAVVGTHVFYRWNSSLGRRRFYTQKYRGELTDPNESGDPFLETGDTGILASGSSDPEIFLPSERVEPASGGQLHVTAAPPRATAGTPIADRGISLPVADRNQAKPLIDDISGGTR